MRGIRLCGPQVAERFADASRRLRVLTGDQPSVDDDLGRPVGGRMMMRAARYKRAGKQEGNRLVQLDGPLLVIGESRDVLAGDKMRAVAQRNVDQCRGGRGTRRRRHRPPRRYRGRRC